MTALIQRFAPYVLCVVLAGAFWLQRATLRAQAVTLADYGERFDKQEANLKQLTEHATKTARDVLALESKQDGFRTALGQREIEIGELQRENETFRLWADAALPELVAGMRDRPALTGADAYAEYLRTRQPLHPAGGQPEDKRRLEPSH
jgi:LysB family phage lysis regulatory protein